MEFHGFAQHPEDNRVLAGIVTGAHRVVANFVLAAWPRLPLAAVPNLALAHDVGNDPAEGQRRAARRVTLESMMALDDFHIAPSGVIPQRAGGGFTQLHQQVHRQTHVGCPDDRHPLSGRSDHRLLCVAEPRRGHDQRDIPLHTHCHDRRRAVRHGEIDHHVGRRAEPQGQGNAERTDRRQRPASAPSSGWPGHSRAATSSNCGSLLLKATSRRPMRPAAPWMASLESGVISSDVVGSVGYVEQIDVRCSLFGRLAVEPDRLDDLFQVIGHRHGAVGVRGPPHAAAAEHTVEFLLIGAVVGNGRVGVFELVSGQDADDALVSADHTFRAELFGTGHAGGTGRLAAEAARADLRFRVQDLLIRYLADHAVARIQGP